MALLFMDGFESESSIGNFQQNQNSATPGTSNPGFAVDTVVTRGGLRSVKFGRIVGANGSQNQQYTMIRDQNGQGFDTSQVTIGFAMKQTFGGSNARATDQTFAQFTTVTDQNGPCIKQRGSDKRLELMHIGTSYGLGPSVLVDGVQYYFQVKIKAHATTGSFKMMINGDIEFDITNVAIAPYNYLFNRLLLMYNQGGHNESGWFNVDDVYILDSTGTNTEFQGQCKILGTVPSGAGDVSTFVGVTGAATGQQACNEIYSSNAEYVTSDSSNQKVLFNFADITSTNVVKGIRIHEVGCRSDQGSGLPKIRHLFKNNGAEASINKQDIFYSTSQNIQFQCYDYNPVTGLSWDISTINDSQFGQLIYEMY